MPRIHDNAPPLADRLALDYDALAESVAWAVTLVPDGVPAIMDDAEAGACAETAKAIKSVAARVEKARKDEKADILAAGRVVDAYFSQLSGQLTPIINALIAAINAWQQAKLDDERRAREAEAERLRKEAALFQEDYTPAQPTAPRDAARVTSASGVMASATVVWDFEIVDEAALPRHLLMPNTAAIKASVAGGTRTIPGVRVFEKIRTSLRQG